MIINNAPVNEAIVSNVGEIGEFRIRNSAKAFSILSSGLYANKIRAIIRELSCNAVDSHVAAKKADVPFDVHLPTQLEPWFSIRDYGTGLSHDQVTQIYTTYFESTKTSSNEFIGALGLGSKSPFSYTDNFTVTAIQNGVKGIYSAFINEGGVPSIAKMMDEETDEPAGVEVKFSVNEYYDFGKFADEARVVYTHFKLRPVVTGRDFEFRDVTYETKDIIPGVHHTNRSYNSTAIMGNIAYPIDVPNAEKNLNGLESLLNCGLEMEFDIGELDFQASREGLSYIPQTIESIKRKLELVNAKLAVFIAEEADKIENLWERAYFLEAKKSDRLWASAVDKYVTDTGFKLFENRQHYGIILTNFKLNTEVLAKRYNIQIRSFTKNRGYSVTNNNSPDRIYDQTKKDAAGHAIMHQVWEVPVHPGVRFVVNDLKTGAFERAKNHFRKTTHDSSSPYTFKVYVMEPVDKTKPMNVKAVMRLLSNPPEEYTMAATSLMEKEKAASTGVKRSTKNVTIMQMEERGGNGYYRSQEYVWRDAGKADTFDATKTHYYLPMSGYNIEADVMKGLSANSIYRMMHDSGIKSLQVRIYGVRKGDIELIKAQKNWVNLETFVQKELKKVTPAQLKTLALSMCGNSGRLIMYKEDIVKHIASKSSPYYLAAMNVKDASKLEMDQRSLERLCNVFNIKLDVETHKDAIIQEHESIFQRYELLNDISGYADGAKVAKYINMVDAMDGFTK